jgi:hypothetical protein
MSKNESASSVYPGKICPIYKLAKVYEENNVCYTNLLSMVQGKDFKVFIMKSATLTDPSNVFLKFTSKLQTTVTFLNDFCAIP